MATVCQASFSGWGGGQIVEYTLFYIPARAIRGIL